MPRFDDKKVCTFDGKIGIRPFVHQVAAQRSSINRPAGTSETKSLPVTKQSFADMILNKVLPLIKEKWPDGNKLIYGYSYLFFLHRTRIAIIYVIISSLTASSNSTHTSKNVNITTP
jgi:hypothetical protein